MKRRPLTRELVDAAVVGPELDALVAEHIFGFWQTAWYGEADHRWGRGEGGWSVHASRALPGNLWGPSIGPRGLPRFSTDMSAAWMIVLKLSPPLMDFCIEIANDPEGSAMCRCRIYAWTERSGNHIVSSRAATAAEAICRAALLLKVEQNAANL